MKKQWRFRPHDPDRAESLSRDAGIPFVVAQLLVCRGVHDPLVAREFLEAKLTGLREPDLLPGVATAAPLIHQAIEQKQKIVVYGDYDVDGMTGTALLWRCIRLLGGQVSYYVPNRIDEGYGLNDEALRQLASQGAQLIITVDCGIASVHEARTARELGLQLIVTDHHEFAAELPEAAAIVHPRLPGTAYPFGGLCGAGVALKLAWALCQQASGAKRVSERMRTFLVQAVGLAGIGTVADMVPLVDENRILVRHALKSLAEKPLLGLAKLMETAELHKKPQLTSEDIGFAIGPRLNACGRLGQAQLGVELLTTDSEERAATLAEYINELNKSRQSLEQSVYLAANKQATELYDPEQDAAMVLAGAGWHPGVIGIVAGRLAEKFHRPVVLLSLDELGLKPATGSARSVPGFNLHEALHACSERLISCGGHAAAAGLKLDVAQIDAFREEFCDQAAGAIAASGRRGELWIDAEAPLAAFSTRVVEQMEQLAPFGQGNFRPLLCVTGVTLEEAPRRIGGGGRHLSMVVRQDGIRMRAVCFGGGDWCEDLTAAPGPLALAFRPIINEFRGRRNVELQVADWRPVEAGVVQPT